MNITDIINLLVTILTELIHVVCFKFCVNEKLNINFKKITILIIISIVGLANNLYNIMVIRIGASFLLLVLLNYYWFKKGIKKTIINCIIISIISMIIEFFSSFLIALWVENLEHLNHTLILKYCITTILIISLYIVFSNKFIINKIRKLIAFLEEKINIELTFVISFVLLNFILIKFNINYRNSLGNIFNIIILFIVALLILILLKDSYKNEIYKIKAKDMQDKINKYEKMIDDYRELKHNLNNDLLSIKSISSKKSQSLIDEILKKYNKTYDWINNIDKMPKGLQGLIYLKLEELNKMKLNVGINSKIKEADLKRLTAKQYSFLCDTVGIILDNAIYASEKSKEKIIFINIKQNNSLLVMEIINTFNNKIDLNRIGQKNYSTKENKSGIGLNYITKKRIKVLTVRKEIINNLFKVTICVKLKDASK